MLVSHGEEFNTFRSLVDVTSMLIEQEDHPVFKVLGVINGLSMVLGRDIQIDCELILVEVQW